MAGSSVNGQVWWLWVGSQASQKALLRLGVCHVICGSCGSCGQIERKKERKAANTDRGATCRWAGCVSSHTRRAHRSAGNFQDKVQGCPQIPPRLQVWTQLKKQSLPGVKGQCHCQFWGSCVGRLPGQSHHWCQVWSLSCCPFCFYLEAQKQKNRPCWFLK